MKPTGTRRRLDTASLLEVISGRRRGFSAALLRSLLYACQFPYGLAVRIRNDLFDRGWRNGVSVGVPVISVGNVTTGGTGKTPLVAWLAAHFRQQGYRVVLISRGYGAQAGSMNDEALELRLQLPDVPHLQNANRVSAAREAIDQLDAQVLLLDDGFQHRRLHRDLDLVLLDALAPWGYGHLLPRGLLREPRSGLRRADAIGLSRADLITEGERDLLRRQVERIQPYAVWFEMRHRPIHLVDAGGATEPLGGHPSVPILAFCGLGNPGGFRRSLEQCGYQVLDWRVFPDHHAYPTEDRAWLSSWGERFPTARQIVCTRKDLVKLGVPMLGRLPLRALVIEADFLRGKAELISRIAQELPSAQPAPAGE